VVKQTVLYPVDTIKVRLQGMKADERPLWKRSELFRGVYKGFFVPLIFNAPASGTFFAVKDSVKASVSYLGNIPSTIIAIALAQFPYWLVRQPSEILKVRDQVEGDQRDQDQSLSSSLRRVATQLRQLDPREPETLKGLFQGYSSNIIYTAPADAIKFVIYDSLKAKFGKGGPAQSAALGAVSTIAAQVTTTPLDVARNRIMASSSADLESDQQRLKDYSKDNVVRAIQRIVEQEGPGALMLGVVPRIFRAILSGAIQFSTYEFTKGTK